MATVTQSSTPAGARPEQKDTWIPSGTGIGWLDELHARHAAAAQAWAAAADRAGTALDEQLSEQARHRAEVREALASGGEAPPPPDPAIALARLQLARRDVVDLERELGEIVVHALAELREHRAEIENVEIGNDLRRALLMGPGGDRGRRVAEIREELAAATSPLIETHDTDTDTDNNDETEAA